MLKRYQGIPTLSPSDLKRSLGALSNSEPKSDLYDDLAVLCINCGNYISCDDLEVHSARCTRVQATQLESNDGLGDSLAKLSKLEGFLVKSLTTFQRPGDQNYLKILIRLCNRLKEVATPDDLREVNNVAESLASLLTTFRGKDVLKLYGERLKAIVIEIEREVTAISLKHTVDSLKQQVEFYKQKAGSLEKSIMSANTHFQSESSKAVIDNLDSEVGSKKSEVSDFSSVSSQSDAPSSLDVSFAPSSQQSVSANAKRYFYSQCLAIKLSYPQKSTAHQVPITKLFRQAVDQRIPVTDWTEFIRSKLTTASISLRSTKPTIQLKRMTTLVEASEEESDKDL